MAQTAQSDRLDGREFIERYYANIWTAANMGVDALREWEAEDIDYELPWSDRVKAFKGVEAHAKMLEFFTSSLTSYEIRMTGFHPTADPNEFVIESTGTGRTVRGSEYRNEYIQFITLRDGKIARVREYFNPLAVRDLTG